jgi:hypothetical protein
MPTKIKQEKFKFWTNWTLLSFGIIPLSYIISLIAVLLVQGAFGFGQMDRGTPLSNTLSQIAGGAVIGLGTGIYQKSLLRKVFNISSSWIYTLVIGFAITELIIGMILWQMDLDREKLRFIEFKPLPETLFFACAGLIIGLLQCTILRRYFSMSIYWVIASTLGWGICILVTYFAGFVLKWGFSVFAFILGALLYGAITGATLMWIMHRKE